ncbi:MAG TPA: IMP cyclohydrolase [Victivallales bacterium]|nr:IMP cyclohydrolase [Victivallales bacterium]
MYVGRIVAIGMNEVGHSVGMYRVSSRSFPNRETRLLNNKVSVLPRKGFEADLSKNPYIAYNCIRITKEHAVVSNGSHTDPITEKLAMGYPARDALALSMLAMDYEKDDFNTPRIAGIISLNSNGGFLSIVKKDSIHVKAFDLKPGLAFYVATYEHDTPSSHYKDVKFDVSSACDAQKYIFDKGVFTNLEKPVTAAAVYAHEDNFTLSADIDK